MRETRTLHKACSVTCLKQNSYYVEIGVSTHQSINHSNWKESSSDALQLEAAPRRASRSRFHYKVRNALQCDAKQSTI